MQQNSGFLREKKTKFAQKYNGFWPDKIIFFIQS